jgi:hypothetical protein
MICILNLPPNVDAEKLKIIFGSKKAKGRLVDYYVEEEPDGSRRGFLEFSTVVGVFQKMHVMECV